jgi:amino acid adenylation domain-containing protein
VSLLRAGDGPALFVLGAGNIEHLIALCRALSTSRPVYGVQCPLAGADLEVMAAWCRETIVAVQPEGPYDLAGYGRDGWLAWETACQFSQRGVAMGLLALLNAPPLQRSPHYPQRLAFFEDGVEPALRHLEHLLCHGRPARRGESPSPPGAHRAYPGPVSYFLAAEDITVQAPYRLGWSDLVAGGLEVHLVPGDRVSMLQPPQVSRLAAKLSTCLLRHHAAAPRAPIAPLSTTHADIIDAFDERARDCAALPAIVSDSGTHTYAEFHDLVTKLAGHLWSRLGRRQSRVAVLMRHGTQSAAMLLAILKATQIYAPLDPLAPVERQRVVISELEPALLVTDEHYRSQAEDLAAANVPVWCVPEGVEPLDLTEQRWPPPRPDDLAWILYTSGSTGKPKGVMQTRENTWHFIRQFAVPLELKPGDHVSHLFSMHFSPAVTNICAALTAGATLFPHELKIHGAAHLADWLRREAITVMHAIPSVLRHLTSSLAPQERLSLRAVAVGGEVFLSSDAERLRQHLPASSRIVQVLSCTEGSALARELVLADSTLDDSRVPLGYAVPGVTLRVLDEHGQELSHGEAGELVVESRFLSPGYWRDEALTAASFTGSGDKRRYRSGDRVRRLADGRLVHDGRSGARVKVRGYAIDTIEVQGALLRLDGLRDAAIVVDEADEKNSQLIAYVVTAPSSTVTVTAESLRAALGRSLAEYMVPARFVFVDDLPRTSTGKVDVRALRFFPQAELAPQQNVLTPTEQWLAAMWRDLLGTPTPAPHDDFFKMSGDSLRAATLIARIERRRGCRLPSAALLRAPTLRSLAALIEASSSTGGPSAASCVIPIRPHTGGLPLFCMHVGHGTVGWLRQLSQHLPAEVAIYGVQAAGIDHEQPLLSTIEAMAERYVCDMRQVQASGPYYVLGQSLGGIVAFAVACELQRQGEQVSFVGVGDISCPVPSPSAAQRLAFFERQLARCMSIVERAWYTLLWRDQMRWHHFRDQQLMYYTRWFKCNVLKDPTELRRWQVALLGVGAGRAYRPRPYDGRVTLFYAAEDHHHVSDHRLDWCEFALGGLEVHLVPGYHFNMWREPHVAHSAAVLYACLQRARSGAVSR